jgi:hypothetical protein
VCFCSKFVLPALSRKHGDGLLEEFRRRWDYHKIYTEWMRKLYVYLDRNDTFSGSEHRESTTSVSLRRFKERVFDAKKGDIVSTIQEFVNKDRNGEAVDRSLLKSVVELFLVMGIAMTRKDFENKEDVEKAAKDKLTGSNETYIRDFETPFIENSRAVYGAKSADWISTDSIGVFLIKVEDALQREKARVDAYLNPATWNKLQAAMVGVMIQDRATAALEAPSGLRSMLVESRLDDLARMYRLFKLWPGGKTPLAQFIRDFVREAGESLIGERRSKFTGVDPSKSSECGGRGKATKPMSCVCVCRW